MITFDENRYYKLKSEPLPEYAASQYYKIFERPELSEKEKLDAETLIIPEGYKVLTRMCNLYFAYSGKTTNPTKGIKTVILPSSMELIEANAFAGTEVEYIKFNDGLKYIFSSAFRFEDIFAANLQEADLPDSVEYIGSKSFAYLPKLKKVKLGKKIEIIPFKAFKSCPELEEVILPEGIKLIGKEAFYDCPKLSKINLPKSIQWIDKAAFQGTKINLNDFDFPFLKDGFAVRGENDSIAEFYYGNEETVTIPPYIKTIGAECFAYTNVKKVILGENVTAIKPAAFIKTKNLETVVLNKNINLIPKACFNGSSIHQIEGDISGLRCVGNEAFARSKIKTFRFPKGFETICGSAFRDCAELTDINFEDGVKEIRGVAFGGCINLTPGFISQIDLKKVNPFAFDEGFPFPPDSEFKTVPEQRDYKFRFNYRPSFRTDSSEKAPTFYENYDAYLQKKHQQDKKIWESFHPGESYEEYLAKNTAESQKRLEEHLKEQEKQKKLYEVQNNIIEKFLSKPDDLNNDSNDYTSDFPDETPF